MLYLNANEEKVLTFEVDIHGCEEKDLRGAVRFLLYGVEYGFPVEVESKKVTASIPPLTEVVESDIEDGSVLEAKLELYTDRHYFKPWEGEIKVGAPMQIKAELSLDESDKHHPGISTKLLTAETREPAKAIKTSKEPAEDMMAKIISEVVKQLSEKKPPKGSKKKVVTESKEDKKTRLKNSLRNITEADIYKYMEKNGTKNKKIQDIVIADARKKAESGELLKVFKEVVSALKKPKNRRG